jgi:hypothetical protein
MSNKTKPLCRICNRAKQQIGSFCEKCIDRFSEEELRA